MSIVNIIGAGPGGLAAGILLQAQGFEVHIYEKDDHVGGRSKRLSYGDYTFDSGPTFFMHPDILKSIFKQANLDFSAHIKLEKIDPLYALYFNNHVIRPSSDFETTKAMFESVSKGGGKQYETWFSDNQKKFKKVMPILEKPFPNIFHFLRKDVLAGAGVLHPFTSVFDLLKKTFTNEDLIHTLSFQAKYLGMASFEAPSVFTILPFLEHAFGIYHVEGGLSQINETMKHIIESRGGFIHLNQTVTKLSIHKKKLEGFYIGDRFIKSDFTVLNADFAYSVLHMTKEKEMPIFNHKKLETMQYSVSSMMYYIGLKGVTDLDHHNVFFSKDYKSYLHKLMHHSKDLTDMSFYVHNPSKMDRTLAKDGHSALYILVPAPNLDAGIDWEKEQEALLEQVFKTIKEKTKIDIKPLVDTIHTLSPKQWQDDYHVHKGAVFNFSHGFNQMLHLRPQNKVKRLKGMYLVGGGTHPGSGLPTIYQSAIITSNYISKDQKRKKHGVS